MKANENDLRFSQGIVDVHVVSAFGNSAVGTSVECSTCLSVSTYQRNRSCIDRAFGFRAWPHSALLFPPVLMARGEVASAIVPLPFLQVLFRKGSNAPMQSVVSLTLRPNRSFLHAWTIRVSTP